MITKIPSCLPLMISIGLAGCGLQVPDMEAFGETPLEEAFTEMDLVNHIKCEIHWVCATPSMYGRREVPPEAMAWTGSKHGMLRSTLALTVDDTTSVNPGVSLTRPMNNVISHFVDGGDVTSPQSFAMGLGLQASAQSTRIEILAFTFHVADLLKYDPLRDDETSCNGHGRVSVLGDVEDQRIYSVQKRHGGEIRIQFRTMASYLPSQLSMMR